MKARVYLLMLGFFFGATAVPVASRDYFLPRPQGQAVAFILAGAAAGEPYANQIRQWALRLHELLQTDYGYPPEQIVLLMGQADPEEGRISGPIRREVFKAAVRARKKTLQAGDRVFFFLIGHGTSSAKEAKFVVFGPDISGEDFASILETFAAQDIVVVNTTSSSFPFCAALSGPGRVVISATRSTAEKYDTVFAGHFIDALHQHAGDRDKNRRVSMWEAFLFASRQVEKWYADQGRIPTEHAVLDDNGDGIFSARPDPAEEDGRLAQIAYFDLLSSQQSQIPPGVEPSQVQRLTAKIRELERSVFLLRNDKSQMPEEAYQNQLETLLIELARNARKLRDLNSLSK